LAAWRLGRREVGGLWWDGGERHAHGGVQSRGAGRGAQGGESGERREYAARRGLGPVVGAAAPRLGLAPVLVGAMLLVVAAVALAGVWRARVDLAAASAALEWHSTQLAAANSALGDLSAQLEFDRQLAQLTQLSQDVLSGSRQAFKLSEVMAGTLEEGASAIERARHATGRRRELAQGADAAQTLKPGDGVRGLQPGDGSQGGGPRGFEQVRAAAQRLGLAKENLAKVLKRMNDNQDALVSLTGEVLALRPSLPAAPKSGAPPPCDGRTDMNATWNCTGVCELMSLNCTIVPDGTDAGQCLLARRGFRKLVVLGDSVGYRIMQNWAPRLFPSLENRTHRNVGRCERGPFMLPGFKPAFNASTAVDLPRNYTPGDPMLWTAGPKVFGRDVPGCTDCSGCDSLEVTGMYKGERVLFEFIAMEFARDFELQTAGFETTQQLIRKHLDAIEPDIVLMHQSVHDLTTYDDLRRMGWAQKELREWIEKYLRIVGELLESLSRKPGPGKRAPLVAFSGHYYNSWDGINEGTDLMLHSITELVDTLPNGVMINNALLNKPMRSDPRAAEKLVPDGVHAVPHFFETMTNLLLTVLCPVL
jgi:hypothetical protein